MVMVEGKVFRGFDTEKSEGTFKGRFNMSEAELKEIAKKGHELLETMSEEDLGTFSKHTSNKGFE